MRRPELTALTVSSRSQIEGNGGPTLTLAEQWKGSGWQAVPTPSPGGNTSDAVSVLKAVAATSPTDVWAVGSHTVPVKRQTDTLIEHWDGASWKQVPSVSVAGFSELDAVTTAAAGSTWQPPRLVPRRKTSCWALPRYLRLAGDQQP